MSEMGFGFLRLPRRDPEDVHSTDMPLLQQVVDAFLEAGGSYFDTAYTYLEGESERALREAVVRRWPRERLRIADKLPCWQVKTPADCERLFAEQLERCGVSYFDYYLLHSLNAPYYEICLQMGEFEFLARLKREGRARHIGFSYHDSAALLERILREQPCVEFVQLQINYLDWQSEAIQAAQCYAVAEKYGKQVMVMEPCKGGTLAQLPAEAEQRLRSLRPQDSMAHWAMRFVRNLPQVAVVLSGMNALEQVRENMQPALPLTAVEQQALEEVAKQLRGVPSIPCTACGYCTEGCPGQITIPRCFGLYNEAVRAPGDLWKIRPAYAALGEKQGLASACIGCGRCERHCPQHLPIRSWLTKVAALLERAEKA